MFDKKIKGVINLRLAENSARVHGGMIIYLNKYSQSGKKKKKKKFGLNPLCLEMENMETARLARQVRCCSGTEVWLLVRC